MKVQETNVQSDAIWTIPNIISFGRLLGVPLFLWLILGPQADGWAFVVLVLAGISDWADGKIARATGQITRLGQILDPLADRLYIAAALIGLALRDIIPWWLVLLLLARELVLLAILPPLKKRGLVGLPVHFLGKAATFALLYAFPLLLLGDGTGWFADTARVFGWAFALWGTGLYWYSALLYIEQARRVIRDNPVTA
ncbi:CDP-alcohol phosphatidyltransferase family protein [Candidatus Nanopelagicales bacterium]|nr:CDP-alcohol phosphatidyltransferase family protein [Candidatus Nanopelagicales bacterium]